MRKILIFVLLLLSITCRAQIRTDNNAAIKPDSTMIVRISEIEVYPEYLKEYLGFAHNVGATSVKEEPGVICIYPMQQIRNECMIRILEIYASQEAYQSHIKTAHFQTYKQGTLHMVKHLDLVDMNQMAPETLGLVFKKAANTNSNTMVVYFSATGTTEAVAKQIAAETSAELLEITPKAAYTSADLDWRNSKSRSSVEMNDDKSRPAIKDVKDLSDYEVIYLGYPIWWDLAPRAVYTFIETAKLDGKKVIPFATSGSSSITNSVRVLKQTYPNINWQNGKLLNRPTKADIKAFVK